MGEASAQGGAGTCSGTWAALAALSRMSKQPFCPPRDRPGWGASIRVEGGHPVQRDVTGQGLRSGRRRGAGAGWSPWGTHPKGSPKLRLATQTEVTAIRHAGFLPLFPACDLPAEWVWLNLGRDSDCFHSPSHLGHMQTQSRQIPEPFIQS